MPDVWAIGEGEVMEVEFKDDTKGKYQSVVASAEISKHLLMGFVSISLQGYGCDKKEALENLEIAAAFVHDATRPK